MSYGCTEQMCACTMHATEFIVQVLGGFSSFMLFFLHAPSMCTRNVCAFFIQRHAFKLSCENIPGA